MFGETFEHAADGVNQSVKNGGAVPMGNAYFMKVWGLFRPVTGKTGGFFSGGQHAEPLFLGAKPHKSAIFAGSPPFGTKNNGFFGKKTKIFG